MSRTYRFFLRNEGVNLKQAKPPLVVLLSEKNEPELFFQLQKVLRVKAGDCLTLIQKCFSDNLNLALFPQGVPEFRYEVKTVAKRELTLQFLSINYNKHENQIRLNLALCLPNKPAKLDFILEKAVELGVSKINLLHSDFVSFSHQLKFERLEKIILEASEQSERAFIPNLEKTVNLTDFLQTNPPHLLVAMEREKKTAADSNIFNNIDSEVATLKKIYLDKHSVLTDASKPNTDNALTLLIGPEGGFSTEEKQHINKLNLKTFSLGHQILRMETAAIVALGILNLKLA